MSGIYGSSSGGGASTALAEFNVNVGDVGGVQAPTNTALLGDSSASTARSTVTISQASPGVVHWVGHGLKRGQSVYFTTTGTLPSPLAPNTAYYATDISSPDDFTVSTDAGGAGIVTTTAGSGVHTAYSGGIVANNKIILPYTVADTGNGQGSVDVNTRRFTATRLPAISPFTEIVFTDSAAAGSVFTVVEPGLYSISYTDRNNVSTADVAITKNFTGTGIGQDGSVTLAAGTLTPSLWLTLSALVWLQAGDQIRAVGDVSATYSTSPTVQMRIFRVKGA